MKNWIVVCALILSANSGATENVGIFTCNFARVAGQWKLKDVFGTDSPIPLADGEHIFFANWTSRLPINSGTCVWLMGHADDSLTMRTNLTQGSAIQTYRTDCTPVGVNIHIVADETRTLQRGQFMQMIEHDPKSGRETSLYHNYFATQADLSGIS